jgi:hypothetical protein
MILRRVIEHVRKQAWTAIAIDFFIVVIGVFVGLQVNNWNAARADHARAANYLERLSSDLSADLATFEDRMQFWNNVSEYGALSLAYAETRAAGGKSQWELLLAFFQASQVAEFYTTDATYQELKSAGELGLIADTTLRDALANYYTLGFNPVLTERPAYREHVRGVIPLDIQNYIWTNCYTSDAEGRQQMRDCAPPVSQAEAARIVREIASDAALMRELRYWMSTMHVARLIGRDRINFATSVRSQIQGDAQH